jgi:hypothetical protein
MWLKRLLKGIYNDPISARAKGLTPLYSLLRQLRKALMSRCAGGCKIALIGTIMDAHTRTCKYILASLSVT